MTDGQERVGYKNPPKHTQWKKGQSGNPSRKRPKREKGYAQLIDEAFAKKIEIIENGIPRTVTVFEAILLQLWSRVMAGEKRALTVYLGYRKLAAKLSGGRQIEIVVIPSQA